MTDLIFWTLNTSDCSLFIGNTFVQFLSASTRLVFTYIFIRHLLFFSQFFLSAQTAPLTNYRLCSVTPIASILCTQIVSDHTHPFIYDTALYPLSHALQIFVIGSYVPVVHVFTRPCLALQFLFNTKYILIASIIIVLELLCLLFILPGIQTDICMLRTLFLSLKLSST